MIPSCFSKKFPPRYVGENLGKNLGGKLGEFFLSALRGEKKMQFFYYSSGEALVSVGRAELFRKRRGEMPVLRWKTAEK